MKLRIYTTRDRLVAMDMECDEIIRQGNWLILIVEEVKSELAPIPKRREIASFCNPAFVRVLDD